MLVFSEAKLVFLATPKTGSTAISAALQPISALSIQRPPTLKHTTVHRYHRFLRPYLEAALGEGWRTVALMREPRDWLGSWYRYRSRPDGIAPIRSTQNHSFDSFVQAWCADPRPPYADVGSQERFLRPRQGHGLDHLFRYEDMEGFLAFLEKELSVKITLPALNVSPPGDLQLSATTEAMLRQAAKVDFDLYQSITS